MDVPKNDALSKTWPIPCLVQHLTGNRDRTLVFHIVIGVTYLVGWPLCARADKSLHDTHPLEVGFEIERDEVERPFRFMRLEEAYTQEKGELQIRLQSEYLERTEEEIEITGPTSNERTKADQASFFPPCLSSTASLRVSSLTSRFPSSSTGTRKATSENLKIVP